MKRTTLIALMAILALMLSQQTSLASPPEAEPTLNGTYVLSASATGQGANASQLMDEGDGNGYTSSSTFVGSVTQAGLDGYKASAFILPRNRQTATRINNHERDVSQPGSFNESKLDGFTAVAEEYWMYVELPYNTEMSATYTVQVQALP